MITDSLDRRSEREEIQRLTEERDAALRDYKLLTEYDQRTAERIEAVTGCKNFADLLIYCSELSSLRAELEAVKAAEGELEVWLCPVHKSLDDSRKLEPLDNCVACIRAERNELRRVIETVFRSWPNIRQLIDGWKSGTPADEWSEWDEQVRQETIALSFLMQPVIDAAISQTAQPEEKR